MHIKKRRFVWKRDAVERCNKNLRSRRVSPNILLRSLISHLTSLWGAITRCTRESALAARLLGDPLDTGNLGESALIEVWAKKNECDAHSKPDSDQICRGCLRSRNAAVLEKQSHACFWGERIAAGGFFMFKCHSLPSMTQHTRWRNSCPSWPLGHPHVFLSPHFQRFSEFKPHPCCLYLCSFFFSLPLPFLLISLFHALQLVCH